MDAEPSVWDTSTYRGPPSSATGTSGTLTGCFLDGPPINGRFFLKSTDSSKPKDPARKLELPYRCRVRSCGLDCPICGSPGVFPGKQLPISEPKSVDEEEGG